MKSKLLRQLQIPLSSVNAHGVCSVVETVQVRMPKGAYANVPLGRLADGWRYAYACGLKGLGEGCFGSSSPVRASEAPSVDRKWAICGAINEMIGIFSDRRGDSEKIKARRNAALAVLKRYRDSILSPETKEACSVNMTVKPKKFKPPLTKRKLSDGPQSIAVGKLTHGPTRNGHTAEVRAPKNPSAEPAERWQDLPTAVPFACEIELLERHPMNRVPKPADVARMGASLESEGQLEPILAWHHAAPDRERLQIISGETRWLGAKQQGWETVQVRIVTGIDAARALELLAICNAERTDLDPIEKARLIDQLCKFQTLGGAGFTREQAGKTFGLSPEAASNLVRLLELPRKWQDRVAAGELSQRLARGIVPYAKVQPILDALEEDWADHHKYPEDTDNAFTNAEVLQDAIEGIIYRDLRRLDEKRNYYGHGIPAAAAGNYGCVIDEEYRGELELVELVLPAKGKERGSGKTITVQAATNVKRYDELQVEAIKLTYEAKERKAAKRSGAKVDREEAALPAAFTKRQEEERNEQRAERLAGGIAGWRHRWLCELSAESLGNNPATWRWLLWMMAERTSHVADVFDELVPESGGDGDFDDPRFAHLCQLKDSPELVGKLIAVGRGYLLLKDTNPKYHRVPTSIVELLAAQLNVSLQTAWTNLWIAKPRGPYAAKLEAFLRLHTADQLDEFGDASGNYTRGIAGKEAKLKLLLSIDRPCKLPDSIAPLPVLDGGKPKVAKSAKKRVAKS